MFKSRYLLAATILFAGFLFWNNASAQINTQCYYQPSNTMQAPTPIACNAPSCNLGPCVNKPSSWNISQGACTTNSGSAFCFYKYCSAVSSSECYNCRNVSDKNIDPRTDSRCVSQEATATSTPNTSTPTSTAVTHNLWIGVRSWEVTIVQQILQALGYFLKSISPTGYFGFVTKKAVQNFQKDNGLPITGFFGPLTRRALMPFFNKVPENAVSSSSTNSPLSACLPYGITLDTIASASATYTNYEPIVTKVTVGETLNGLKAYCQNNKLLDGSGKEIYFYYLTGCGGPALTYEQSQAIIKKQQDGINALKNNYTVVQITCNPSGLPLP